MNKNVDELEIIMKKLYGDDITLPRYSTKDWLTKDKKES